MDQSSHKLREQHWMTIIQQCNRESKEEGITKLEWMERNNINYHSFYRWQHKLRNNIASELLIAQAKMPVAAVVESPVPQFAEVLPPQPCTVADASSKTVLRCKNITVELSEDITDQLLMRLIKVLSYVET